MMDIRPFMVSGQVSDTIICRISGLLWYPARYPIRLYAGYPTFYGILLDILYYYLPDIRPLKSIRLDIRYVYMPDI